MTDKRGNYEAVHKPWATKDKKQHGVGINKMAQLGDDTMISLGLSAALRDEIQENEM